MTSRTWRRSRHFARRFAADERRLDVLVHNAGLLPAERQRTEDGFEVAFATNVLGPFVLTACSSSPSALDITPA